jgi:cation-transporting P-type ATPase E
MIPDGETTPPAPAGPGPETGAAPQGDAAARGDPATQADPAAAGLAEADAVASAAGLAERGLTSAEVQERIAAGRTNVAPPTGGRTTWDIVRSNTFTFFNGILGVLFVVMMIFGNWRDALFGWVIVINSGIGIYQEMRAKLVLDRLNLLTAPAAKVIREGQAQDVPIAEVVLDDVVRVAVGDQIVADGDVLVSRDLELDESLLTGESVPVQKGVGAELLSGSFVVAGSGVFVTTAVGSDAYAQRIAGESKRYQRLHSDLVSGINGFLRVIAVGILPVAAIMIWAQFRMDATVQEGVTNTVAALVAMIPQGLVLMTSIAFAVAAVTLARRKVLTRELPAVEGLARVDVLCIDKTGTITEPQPAFERVELVDGFAGDGGPPGVAPPADGREGVEAGAAAAAGGVAAGGTDAGHEALVLQVLGAIAATASHANSTLTALGEAIPAPAGWTVEESVPFASARKWSAARLAGRGSWVLGAPEIVASDADTSGARARDRAAEVANEGLRVLLLSHTDAHLQGETLPDGLTPVSLVILAERVRQDAPETLAYFRKEGVQIKVISGDNPATVATIAAKAGVEGADRAVDARYLPAGGEELADMMDRNTVFGRVNPDQKAAMVEALQRHGHTVAMTGDGVNDVLALKKADIGIAMGTGTAAAQAVSQLVLVDSRFATLPGVLAEGRRVTANIERVAHLFLNKTVWAALLAIAVAIVATSYPILPRHLTAIDGLTIGVPAFFLALAPNFRRFVPGFAYRVARFVLPTGFLSAVAMLVSFLTLRELGATLPQAQTMEVIIFATIGLRVISVVERPLRGWRLGLVLAIVGVYIVGFWWRFTAGFFAVVWPTDWVVILVAAIWCAFVWFWVGLGKPIGDRLPFWKDKAHTTERQAAESAARGLQKPDAG